MENITSPKYISFIKENRTLDQASQIYNQRIADSKIVYERFSDEFITRSCPVCNDHAKEKLPSFHNLYGVVRCQNCLTQYVDPCPSLNALAFYYNTCSCNALLGKLYRSRHNSGNLILSDRTQYIIDLIKTYFEPGKHLNILEIGCSSGAFLSELKDALTSQKLPYQYTLHGIDIDEQAIKKSVDTDISLQAISAESYSEHSTEKYDLVLHFELIEHLSDPHSFMKSIKSLLNHGGLQHFHTPNANGFDNQAMGYNDFRALAHGLFPPMHLQAFTPQNLTHFALRSGFQMVNMDTPGNFDVDIVVNTLPKDSNSPFRFIHNFTQDQLAIVQSWLKLLCGSSHLRCTLRR
jgi:2-polyprenyl-6-hydroxyphenyl methylase/3-demethylubiquinone-9 3-methyltransferase